MAWVVMIIYQSLFLSKFYGKSIGSSKTKWRRKISYEYRDLELDKEKCLVLMKGQEIHFTSTEYKLLLYLMENRGRVVTKAMLLEQLWDIDGNFVDDNTVRVNIKRLRQKLNDEKQEYIVTVLAWATLLENDDEAFCDL